MTQQAQHAITDEFDAAKVIVETLKGLDEGQQVRAIKFACESLQMHAPTVGAPSVLGAPSTPPSGLASAASSDIRQFTASKSPKSDLQFAAVVAYFYRFVAPEAERKDAIAVEDLKDAARKVGRKRPHRATLNNAKNAGYLDAAERGSFKINTVGENLVAVTLPGNGGDATGGSGGGRRKKAKARAAGKRKRARRA